MLTENAVGSPIVREEIGYALGQGKLVVPLVTPAVARNPAALGLLNGREHIPFDIADPQEGLIKLTDWVNVFARQKQGSYTARNWPHSAPSSKSKPRAIAQLQAQNDVAMLLLVFTAAVALVVIIGKAS